LERERTGGTLRATEPRMCFLSRRNGDGLGSALTWPSTNVWRRVLERCCSILHLRKKIER